MTQTNELDARARALRLGLREIAAAAELDQHTVIRVLGRAKRGREVLTSSQRRVALAIEQAELKQLAYLRGLHPEKSEAAE